MQSAVEERRSHGPKRKASFGQRSLLSSKRKCTSTTPKAPQRVTTMTTSNGEQIELVDDPPEEDSPLLPCRVRRNYACKTCNYTTTNPRMFLYHQRDAHAQKGNIHECAYCVYASVHSHKLLRHITLVHRLAVDANANDHSHPNSQPGYLSSPPAATLTASHAPLAVATAPSAFPQLSADGVPLPPDLEVILVEDDPCPSMSAASEPKTVRPMLMEPSVVLLPVNPQHAPALPPLHRQKIHPRHHIRPESSLLLPPPPLLSSVRAPPPLTNSLIKQERRKPAEEEQERPQAKGKPAEEFACSVCPFKSKSKVLVQRHEKVSHLKKKFFRCTKCNYVTSVRARYTKHVRYHDMPYIKCETCDFSTPYKWNLDRHRRNHLEEGGGDGSAPDGMEVFKCYKCTFSTLSKQSLSVHLLNHHAEGGGYRRPRRMEENGPGSASPGQDQQWGYSQSQPSGDELEENGELEIEENIESENEQQIGSRKEDQGGSVKEDQGVSENEEQGRSEKEEQGGCVKVENGGSENEDNDEENHVEAGDIEDIEDDEEEANNETAAKPYACVECRETFPSVSLLDRHAYEFHEIEHPRRPPVRKRTAAKRLDGKPKVKCDLCPYEAKWISEVVRHRRVHIQDKPYACPHCEFRSRWKGDMTRHIIKYHGGDGDSPFEGDGSAKVEEDKAKDADVNNFEQLLDQTMMVGGEEDLHLVTPCSAASPVPEQDLPLDLSRPLEGDVDMSPGRSRAMFGSPGREGGTGLLPFLLRIPPRRIPPQEIRTPIHLSPSLQLIPTSASMVNRDGKVGVPNMRPPSTLTISPAVVSHGTPSMPLVNAPATLPEKDTNAPMIRKTFQCPYCSYSTTTASRFHMHIVVHLNQKPYMCSECGYRSNWQWDITKHSKMKAHRDPRHASASVIVVNDVGNKNYEKYEKYAVYETIITKPRNKAEQPSLSISPVVEGGSGGRTLSLSASLPSASSVLARPPSLKSKMPKKISFKCKYCEFRDNTRRNIIRHMGVHSENKPFWCGICGQSSNCRNVILRHCHVRHGVSGPIMQRDGDKSAKRALPSQPGINGELGFEEEEEDEEEEVEEIEKPIKQTTAPPVEELPPKSPEVIEDARVPPGEPPKLTKTAIEFQEDKSKRQKCPICPYRCRKLFDLRIHSYMHKPHEGANFKCMFCPFYVNLKRSWFQHMKLHVDQPHEYVKQCLEGVVPSFLPAAELKTLEEKNVPKQVPVVKTAPTLAVTSPKAERLKYKRHRCEQCPYSTDSHTTFLYHRQFHRPGRTGVFKCTSCSYAVSKYHLLIQHVRLHELESASGKETQTVPIPPPKPIRPNSTPNPPPSVTATPESPHQASDIARVWVQRDGVFKKMFKCPHCPHISLKRTVITDHEKMHFKRKSSLGKTTFMCNQCNYTCRNSGALTAHQRMHQEHENSVGYITEKDYALSRAPAKPKSPKSPSPVKERPMMQSPVEFNIDAEQKWIRLVDPGKQFFGCGKCPAKFTKPQQIVFHRALHGAGYKWKCTLCDYSARHRPHLHKHSKVHSQEYMDEYVVDTSNRPSSRRRASGIIQINMNNGDFADTGPKTSMLASPPPHGKSTAQTSQNINSPLKSWTSLTKATVSASGKPITKKNYSCHLCPSVFIKYSTLVYHLHLHGSKSKYKCQHCTYAVANIGNLVRHSKVHCPDVPQARDDPAPMVVPSDTSSPEKKSGRSHSAMRLSCPKCPAVFDKKLRHDIHVALHGSKQRFQCDRCDYAVQFAANMVRHKRMHTDAEARAAAAMANASVVIPVAHSRGNPSTSTATTLPQSKSKTASNVLEETFQCVGGSGISPAEKQHILLQRLQDLCASKSSSSTTKDVSNATVPEPKKMFRCERCPYSHQRKDVVQSHMRRHVTLPAFEPMCPHCDYGTSLTNILKEHIQMHFKPFRFHQVDAFVEWEEFEIWAKFGNSKRLIYKHSVDGKEFTEEDVYEMPGESASVSGDEVASTEQDADARLVPSESGVCKDLSEPVRSEEASSSNEVEGVVKSLVDEVEGLDGAKGNKGNSSDAESVEKNVGKQGEGKKSQKRACSPKTRRGKSSVIKDEDGKASSSDNDRKKSAPDSSSECSTSSADVVKPLINGDSHITNTADCKTGEKNTKSRVKEKPPNTGGLAEVHNSEEPKGITIHVS